MKIKRRFLAGYLALLVAFTTYVTLDTFVITRVYGEATDQTSEQAAEDQTEDQSETQDNSQEIAQEEEESSGHGPGSHGSGHGPGRHGKPGSGSSGKSDSSDSETESSEDSSSSSSSGSSLSQTGTTYSDSNISISIKETTVNDTAVYIADVQLSDPEYLKTALAQESYGRNVTEKTSEIASGVNAILAINGDYYGAQEKGYVIRNGVLYRDTSAGGEDLVIYEDGSFKIINEDQVTASQLIADGAVQTLSFGPALVENGVICVTEDEEVGKAMTSNPRTAIGIIDECHYVLVVSDGRTDESEGLTLHELAELMDSLGVSTAYNLDGGGSSTMYFNGEVINNPTTGGSIKERSVSDIVYIGY